MVSIKKVGGLTFVRAWRLSFSYCLCKATKAATVNAKLATHRALLNKLNAQLSAQWLETGRYNPETCAAIEAACDGFRNANRPVPRLQSRAVNGARVLILA